MKLVSHAAVSGFVLTALGTFIFLPFCAHGGPTWGLEDTVSLDWEAENHRSQHDDQNGDYIPRLPDGLRSRFLVVLNRHGARTHQFHTAVREFGGSARRQLVAKGVSQVYNAGQEVRMYFDKQMVPELDTPRRELPDDIDSSEATPLPLSTVEREQPFPRKQEEASLDAIPGIHASRWSALFVRSSCYSRCVLSAKAWVSGFYGQPAESAVSHRVLTSVEGNCGIDPETLLQDNFVPVRISAPFPQEDDVLLCGMIGGHMLPWLAQQLQYCFNEPLMRDLQKELREKMDAVCPILGEAACSELGWQVGDMVNAEEFVGVEQPLKAVLTYHRVALQPTLPDAVQGGAIDINDQDLAFSAEAAKDGFRKAMFLLMTYPSTMEASACGHLLLFSRLLRLRASGSVEDATKAADIMEKVRGFDDLLRPSIIQKQSLMAGDRVAAVQQAVGRMSVMLVMWHDYAIIALLGLLGVRSDTVVPFAASLMFELAFGVPQRGARSEPSAEAEPSDTSPEFYVRVLYGVPGRPKQLLRIPKCEEYGLHGLCPLDVFTDLAESDGRCDAMLNMLIALSKQRRAESSSEK